MTIAEFLKREWRPGDFVCERNAFTGAPARTGDEFHALAVARVRTRLVVERERGQQRGYGDADPAALCDGCIESGAGRRDRVRRPL